VRLDPSCESVLAWEADSGRPLDSVVKWQASHSRRYSTGRGRRSRGRGAARAGAARPNFSAGQLRMVVARDASGGRALAAGILRIGTVDSSCATGWGASRDRPVDGLEISFFTRRRPRVGTEKLIEISASELALTRSATLAGDLGTLRHPSRRAGPVRARCGDNASRARRRRGCVPPGPGQRQTGRRSSCSHTQGTSAVGRAGACSRRSVSVDGRPSAAIAGQACSPGALLEWLPRNAAGPRIPPRLASAAAGARTGGSGCCRSLAGVGAPWWKPRAPLP